MGEVLQEQLQKSQEAMKSYMNNEVAVVSNIVDKIQTQILPETLVKIDGALKDA